MDSPTANVQRSKRRRRSLTALPWFARPFPADGTVGELPAEAINEARGVAEVELRESRYRRALGLADAAAAALSLVAIVSLVGGVSLRPTSLIALPLVVLVAKLQGLYDRDELLVRKTTIDEAPRLFQLATQCALVFWLVERWIVHGNLSPEHVLALWALLWVAFVASRWVARAFTQNTVPGERCVFVGDAAAYERLRVKIDLEPGIRAQLVGRMALRGIGRAENGDASRRHDVMLRDFVAETRAHRLVIDTQALPPSEMLDFVRAAKALGVRVSLLPGVLDVVGSSVVFDELHGMTVLGVRRFGLTWSSLLVKRMFDLAGSLLVLVLVGPLMALIALAIKLDSRGPVLFRQTRIGRDGEPFRICKFRTMVADAESRKAELLARNEAADGLFKIADDPRITRVGRLLRRTSLDELPQLFNVVKGDMSLVGPRPLVVDEDVQITGWDRRRLQLTPGMTGQWQIAGSSRVPLQEMVKIDYVYVAGWSLWSDVKILLRTVPYVFRRRGL